MTLATPLFIHLQAAGPGLEPPKLLWHEHYFRTPATHLNGHRLTAMACLPLLLPAIWILTQCTAPPSGRLSRILSPLPSFPLGATRTPLRSCYSHLASIFYLPLPGPLGHSPLKPRLSLNPLTQQIWATRVAILDEEAKTRSAWLLLPPRTLRLHWPSIRKAGWLLFLIPIALLT